MKYLHYLFIFWALSVFSQEFVETALVKKTALEADALVSVNNFDTTFYIYQNVLFKKSKTTKGLDIGYNNFQLGEISSVNTFNPLKINVFYKDFNTAIILDNRLAEMFKVDFNTISPYRNISHITTGNDNTIWVFNQNTQQLELFDYKTNSSRSKTLPVKSEVLGLKSNYNTCFLLTKRYLYVYNYFGSLIKKIRNDGFTNFAEDQGNFVFKKGNNLFYLDKNSGNISPIKLPNLLINQFFVTNETLYIYNNETLYEFQIKID